MNNNTSYRTGAVCSAVTGSMTMALKAKKILAGVGIRANAVKLSSKSSTRGCVYGVEYPCELSGNVRSMLRSAGIDIQ